MKQTPEQLEQTAIALLHKMQSEKKSLQEALNLSEEFLEQIYSLAHGYYGQGKYPEALSLFHFLAGASPESYKYMFGLASTYYQLKDYVNAGLGFGTAVGLDPHPEAAYYASLCFLNSGLKDETKEMLEIAILIAGDKKEYAPLKGRCEVLKNSLA